MVFLVDWVMYPWRVTKRAWILLQFFSGNYLGSVELFWYPLQELAPSSNPFVFPNSATPYTLPTDFTDTWSGEAVNTKDFLNVTDTVALMIVHKGEVVFEEYYYQSPTAVGGAPLPWSVQSVSKTVVATAVGLALNLGYISSLDDSIDEYVDYFEGSEAFEGISIRRILQMSSCVAWSEEYDPVSSDFLGYSMRLIAQIGVGGFAADQAYDEEDSEHCSDRSNPQQFAYKGINTQALVELVKAVVPQDSMTAFLQQELWDVLGMQDRAYFQASGNNREVGPWGLSATARDLAKLAELYRNKGSWNGRQLLSSEWVDQATRATETFLQRSVDTDGYGFQIWLPSSVDPAEDDYAAMGVLNQFVYVNPSKETVIVKYSASSVYYENGYYYEHYSFLRQISSELFNAQST